MSQLEIRPSRIDDTYPIADLLHQLGYETEPRELEALILKSLDGDGLVCVGIRDGTVVAVMSLIFFDYFPSGEKLCRITSMVVDEKVRGLGVGTKMVEHAKSRASAAGCSRLEVTTSLEREQARRFYESSGFRKSSYRYVQVLRKPD